MNWKIAKYYHQNQTILCKFHDFALQSILKFHVFEMALDNADVPITVWNWWIEVICEL
jgi:hypothetical protein